MDVSLVGGRRNLTAQSFALDALRSSITQGTLTPGTRLVLSELAARLGVSVTPVREAIRDLAAEGLVVILPNRSAFVREIDIDEAREIYELRCALEPIMVKRMMARVTTADLEKAKQLNIQMAQSEKNLTQWVELNHEFHTIFSENRDESELATILERLRANAVRYVKFSLQKQPRHLAESHKEHAQIVDAFLRKDLDGATALTIKHLQETIHLIEEVHKSKVSGES